MSNSKFDDCQKIVEIMDFMVQAANRTIDGLFIGELSKNGLADYRRYLNNSGKSVFDKDCEKVNEYVVGEDFKFGFLFNKSLLSLYNVNQLSQN